MCARENKKKFAYNENFLIENFSMEIFLEIYAKMRNNYINNIKMQNKTKMH